MSITMNDRVVVWLQDNGWDVTKHMVVSDTPVVKIIGWKVECYSRLLHEPVIYEDAYLSGALEKAARELVPISLIYEAMGLLNTGTNVQPLQPT